MSSNEDIIRTGSQLGGSGNIVGVTFNDTDNDGVFDTSESPIPGVTVYLDQNNNGIQDPNELSNISRSDGVYNFLGLVDGQYSLRQVPPSGTVSTTPLPVSVSIVGGSMVRESRIALGSGVGIPPTPVPTPDPTPIPPPPPVGPGRGNISGVLFEDVNINGVRDPGEPGISGSQVFLDANRNGILEEGEASTLTDEFGFYSYVDVFPGQYNIDVIREPNEARTTPNSVAIITGLEPEQPNIALDIGIVTPSGTGNVEGVKYLDLNANGILDSGEPGIPNFTIYADLNSNHILDVGEPFNITDSNGFYFLPNLPSTRVTIREAEQQLGFNLTTDSRTVDVPSGGTVPGINFGNAERNVIAGVNFVDNNANGAIDPGDVGLSNSTVYLDLNENGIFDPEEPFSITNSQGEYSFNTLPPDTYVVRVVPQPGFTQTTPDPVILVASGDDANFVNLGTAPATPVLQGDLIGNNFNDFNSNGVLDPGEPGLANFTLYLDQNGNNILDPTEPAAISNATGDFSFTNPPVGTYFLREIPQPGFVKTTPDQEITLNAPINVLQGDAPLVFNVGNAVVGEPVPAPAPAPAPAPEQPPAAPAAPVPAAPPEGTTDTDTATAEGTTDTDTATAEGTTDTDTATTEGTTDTDTATTEGTTNTGIDAPTDTGVTTDNPTTTEGSRIASQVTTTGRIAGTKFSDNNGNNIVDPNEPGLGGFTIYLDTNNNQVLDPDEPTSVTNVDGSYSFEGLAPNTYVVREVQQPGFTQITPDPVITIVGGDSVDFVNIGNQPDVSIAPPPPTPIPPPGPTPVPPPVLPPIVNTDSTGIITGAKFDDRNGDGLAGPDEPRLIGVEIFVDLNNNGLAEANEPFTLTDVHGEYRFALPPGNYRVRETPPAGFVNTTPTPFVPVVPGQTVVYNFGDSSIFDPNTSISGVIFTDSDNSGSLGSGEAGIPTAQVFLDLDGNGTLDPDEPETFTDPDGRYTFNGLIPGNYTVDVVLQENLFLTSSNPNISVTVGQVPPDPNISPTPINLPVGQSENNIDLGVNVTAPGGDTVSGIVFADNNGNGLFEPLKGEVGLPGVEVFLDTHRDGQIQGFEPNQISGPDGTYGLDVSDVDSGSYPLRQVLRTGFTQTTSTVEVSVGGDSVVYNFGNQAQTLITGTVFEDFNSNGIQDFNDTNGNGILDPNEFVERGAPGFRIYVDINENGILDNDDIEPNTFSNTDGEYAIVGLLPGTYTLRLNEVPGSFVSTTPTELTITVDEFSNSNLEIDFGQSPIVPPPGFGNISGIAFIDENGDGQASPGEPQLPNALIYIDADEDGERGSDERFALTDQFGRYDLSNVSPGTYVIRQEPLPGFTDSTTPEPIIVTLIEGDNADFVNFANDPTGLPKAVLPVVSIGGVVFNDINGDGLLDPGENGIPGTTVFLDRNDNSILDNEERTAITDSLGVYDFGGLPPGTYTVLQVPPPGLFQTNQDPTLTLFAGDDANFVNFGNSATPPVIPPPPPPSAGTGGISGITFEDLNGNGLVDPGEGIGGVVIYFDQNNNSVRDADEIFVASDVNGNYGFSNLADAAYTVRQELNPDQAAIFTQTVPPLGEALSIATFGGANVPGANFGNIRL
ncbi:MAG: SdrD B-like domain-containing protein [Cyanobacteriota bacterium]|nr:SdrD B-like domain-containing protein [Cyanobacteriota bacterium]